MMNLFSALIEVKIQLDTLLSDVAEKVLPVDCS